MSKKMLKFCEISEENQTKIYQKYDVTPLIMKTNIRILREWIKHSAHLPQNQDDRLLENFIIRCKCQMEKAKAQIESYYTLKGMLLQYFKHDNMIPSEEGVNYFPTLKRTPNNERIVIYRYPDPTDASQFDSVRSAIQFVLVMDLLIKKDYSDGFIIVCDLNCTLEHITKLRPFDGLNCFKLIEKGLASRISSIHFINGKNYVNMCLSFAKLILSSKLYKRVHVYNEENMEDFYKVVPKECLPKEYGGTNGTVKELEEFWDSAFITCRDEFEQSLNEISDESKRIGGPKYDSSFLGSSGTFKTLTVD